MFIPISALHLDLYRHGETPERQLSSPSNALGIAITSSALTNKTDAEPQRLMLRIYKHHNPRVTVEETSPKSLSRCLETTLNLHLLEYPPPPKGEYYKTEIHSVVSRRVNFSTELLTVKFSC